MSWLVEFQPQPDALLRLVCFPHAGGDSNAYRTWSKSLGDKVDVIGVSYPGRGARIQDTPATSLREMVDAIATEVAPLMDLPFVFFGHSFGSLIAYEVAMELQLRGAALPLGLFVSAMGAPSLGGLDPTRWTHTLSDDEFIQAVTEEWGFMDAEALSNPELRAITLPPLRADLTIHDTYVFGHTDASSLPIPIVAYGGGLDQSVSIDNLKAWAGHTVAGFELETFADGGHFYTVSHASALLESVSGHLNRFAQLQPPSAMLGEVFETTSLCTHERVSQQALARPDNLCVIGLHRTLTYSAVIEEAHIVARKLQAMGVGKGSVVGLYLPHCEENLLANLAVWFAGTGFLMMETSGTPALLEQLIESMDVNVVVTDSTLAANLPFKEDIDSHVLIYEKELGAVLAGEALPELIDYAVGMDDLAYVSMTSGSTGAPKGVLVPHRSAVYCFEAGLHLYPYREQEPEFEGMNVFFAWNVMRPLLVGSCAVMIPDEIIFDPPKLLNFIYLHSITRIMTTPSLLQTILNWPNMDFNKLIGDMTVWYLEGEVVPQKLVRCWDAIFSAKEGRGACLANCYSTWESCDISYANLNGTSVGAKNISAPAGSVLPGQQVFLMPIPNDSITSPYEHVDEDPMWKPVPMGQPGEIWVSSPGLSLGYTEEKKTRDKFRPNPFKQLCKDVAGSDAFTAWPIIYNTGDVGRVWGDHRTIAVLGRADNTVKLRGFKVSILYVEDALSKIPDVNQVAVRVLRDKTSKQPTGLVAYVVGKDGKPDEQFVTLIEATAKRTLPEYAVPQMIIPMEALPMKQGESRKLDRKAIDALPLPDRVGATRKTRRVPTNTKETKIEQLIKAAIQKVLDVEGVHVEENFFDLGGNSLKAAALAGELSVHGIDLPVLDIYSNPTTQSMAAHVESTMAPPPSSPKSVLGELGVAAPNDDTGGQLAVIGMAGYFPGAPDVSAFWQNLQGGVDSISELSLDDLRDKGVDAEILSNPEWVPAAYKIDGADHFDAPFWGVGRAEATLMDPQQRLFLQCAWEAVESAGYAPETGTPERTGVFAACGIDGYLVHHYDGAPLKDGLDPGSIFLGEVGNEKDYISTRVAFQMNLMGPAMTINSACSSGLVAVAQAAQAIRAGQCDMAIAGASALTFPNFGYLYSEGLVGSPDGKVRPFDQDASGTNFGDSVGAVVLKRVQDAEAAGDHIWAVLEGYGVSNDGKRKAGFSAPSAKGQRQAILDAQHMAGVSSETISYVECHATATNIGDGIELSGLTDAFKMNQGVTKPGALERHCAIGSVKGNIGHANCAAGITGLIKTILCLEHQRLCPTVHFNKVSNKLRMDTPGSPFFVNDGLKPWKLQEQHGDVRRAGVSSFGIGGTNCHMVLREYQQRQQTPAQVEYDSTVPEKENHLLTFSAKTSSALISGLDRMAHFLRDYEASASSQDGLKGSPSTFALPMHEEMTMTDIAYTLHVGRETFSERVAVLCPDDFNDAAEVLAERANSIRSVEQKRRKKRGSRTVALCFPDYKDSVVHMGASLYQKFSSFRSTVDECCDLLLPLIGFDLRPQLPSDLPQLATMPSHSNPTAVAQLTTFVTEYALARVFLDVGIVPAAVFGQGVGEFVALAVSGLLSVEDTLKILVFSVRQPEQISTNQKLEEYARGFEVQPADIPMVSSVTNTWLENISEPAAYWTMIREESDRCTVSGEGARVLAETKPDVVVEMGPSSSISDVVAGILGEVDMVHEVRLVRGMSCPLKTNLDDDDEDDDVQVVQQMIGKLWEAGVDIQWDSFLKMKLLRDDNNDLGLVARRVPLPTYTWDNHSYWVNPEKSIYVKLTPAQLAEIRNRSALKPVVDVSRQQQRSAVAVPLVPTSPRLVRFAPPKSSPSVRVYCLPFAGGSSLAFKKWASSASLPPWLEVVAVELCGRSARAGTPIPSNDAQDTIEAQQLARDIAADAGTTPLALLGLSMGSLLGIELAVELKTRLALGESQLKFLGIAGRQPPHKKSLDNTAVDSSLYNLAPAEIVESEAWRDFFQPMLEADLIADERAAVRLARVLEQGEAAPSSSSPLLQCPVGVFSAKADVAFDWKTAGAWSDVTALEATVTFFSGGHEFLKEQIQDIGRGVEAALQAHACSVQPSHDALAALPQSQGFKPEDPCGEILHSVEWKLLKGPCTVASITKEHGLGNSMFTSILMLNDEPAKLTGEHLQALSGSGLVIFLPQVLQHKKALLRYGTESLILYEERQCWNFMALMQDMIERELSGKIVLLCPASWQGAMTAGASKSVGLEYPDLTFQRIHYDGYTPGMTPDNIISGEVFAVQKFVHIVSLGHVFEDETDLWVSNSGRSKKQHVSVLAPRLVPAQALSSEAATRELQVLSTEPTDCYLVTGGTGGVGSALVDWLLDVQHVPAQCIVLLTRRPLDHPRAVRTICVDCSDRDALWTCKELRDLDSVTGIFHLAGVLDDGLVTNMTLDRVLQVAAPKLAVTSLMAMARQYSWDCAFLLNFSSTSSLLGYPGQSNYCAANALLDNAALFSSKFARDLTAPAVAADDSAPPQVLTINWGPWGEVGMAQVGTRAYDLAVKEGDIPLRTEPALTALSRVLYSFNEATAMGQVPKVRQFAVADVKWERSVNWSGMPALREIEHKPTEFVSSPDDVVISNDEMSPLPRSVSCCAKSPVVEFLQDHVPSWDESSDLMSLGMDSLDLVQMRNTFNRKFKTKVPMDVFMSPTQTLLEIVGRLESEIPDLICAASRSIPVVPGFKMDTEKSLVVEFLQDHVPSWDESSDLMSLGMDSLDLVQMRNTFNRKFKTKVPMDAFMSPTQTLLEIVGRLESEIPNRRGPTTTSSSPPLEPAGLLKPAWWSLLGEGKVSERMALAARKHKSHEEVDLAAGQERILTVRTQGMNGSELRASTRVSNSMLLASVR